MTATLPTGAYALTTRLRNASAEPLRAWVAAQAAPTTGPDVR